MITRRRNGVARSRAAGLYPAFAGLGATGAIVPAALPTLAEKVGVPTAAVLPAVPLLFTGLFAGVAVMPILTRRAGAGRIVALGALLQAVSLLGLALAGTTGLVVSAAAAAGVGFGIAESAGTALVRRLLATAGEPLIGLTAVSAAAAVVTPLAVVAAADPDTVGFILAAAALPHLLAAVALLRHGDPPRARSSPGRPDLLPAGTRNVAVALFCYVGAETLLSGWSAALAQSSYGLSPQTAALGTSAFWTLLMAGRLTAVAAARRGAAPRVILALCQVGAATCLAGGVCVAALSGASATTSAATASLVGLAVTLMGPCYALVLGRGVGTLPESATDTGTAGLVAAGALGGTVWSAAVAGIPAHLHAAAVTVAACVGMVGSAVAVHRSARAARSNEQIP